MLIPDSKYDQVLAFINSGARGKLRPDLVEYISVLELIRGMHLRYENRNAIISFLQQPPYNFSEFIAVSRYTDALNLFYLNNDIKKQAWRNIYAEKLDRAADLVLKTATCAKDLDIYKNIILSARDMRQLHLPDVNDIPPELFQKPTKLYSLDPELIGKKRANRQILAKHIDSLKIPETEKLRLKSDAMIEEIDFLPSDENE